MKTMTTARRFEVVGVNDDQSTCQCCGKQNLKRVVWIQDNDTSEVRHYGTTCAANPAKAFGLGDEIKQAVRAFQDKHNAIWSNAHRLYRIAGGRYVSNGIALHLEGGAVIAADMALLNECHAKSKEAMSPLFT